MRKAVYEAQHVFSARVVKLERILQLRQVYKKKNGLSYVSHVSHMSLICP